MKKLLLLLLFIPLVSFGQDEVTVIQSKTNISSSTNVENELVLSEKSINIKTPFTADLSKYTHLLIVECQLPYPITYTTFGYGSTGNYSQFNSLESMLSLSAFEVMNPYKVDKKRFKKDYSFLKTIKNESYLYLYYIERRGRGDDANQTLIIRDWKNKIIYNATHINLGLNEVFAPLIDY